MKIDFNSTSNINQSVQQSFIKQSVQTRASGSFSSPYADDPRNITNKDYRKIVPVDDNVTRELTQLVKDSFTNNAGMLDEDSRYITVANNYLATLQPEVRSYAGFTLSKIFTDEASRIANLVKEKDPTWDFGQPVKREVLEEVFRPKLDVKA